MNVGDKVIVDSQGSMFYGKTGKIVKKETDGSILVAFDADLSSLGLIGQRYYILSKSVLVLSNNVPDLEKEVMIYEHRGVV